MVLSFLFLSFSLKEISHSSLLSPISLRVTRILYLIAYYSIFYEVQNVINPLGAWRIGTRRKMDCRDSAMTSIVSLIKYIYI